MNVAAAVNHKIAAQDTRDRLRIGEVFLLKDTSRKRLSGIVVVYRNCLLQR